jgi:hypothetical protein
VGRPSSGPRRRFVAQLPGASTFFHFEASGQQSRRRFIDEHTGSALAAHRQREGPLDDLAHRHGSRQHAAPDRKRNGGVSHGAPQRQRAACGAARLIRQTRRGREDRHQAAPGQRLHAPAVGLDHGCYALQCLVRFERDHRRRIFDVLYRSVHHVHHHHSEQALLGGGERRALCGGDRAAFVVHRSELAELRGYGGSVARPLAAPARACEGRARRARAALP